MPLSEVISITVSFKREFCSFCVMSRNAQLKIHIAAVSLFNCSLMPPNEKQIRQRDMLLLLTSWEMLVGNFLGHEIYSSHFGCAHSFWWAIACARISLNIKKVKLMIAEALARCCFFFLKFPVPSSPHKKYWTVQNEHSKKSTLL